MKIGQQQLSFLCVLLFSAVLGIVAAERFAECLLFMTKHIKNIFARG